MENVWLRISQGRYGCCSSNGISGTDDGGGVVPKSVSAQNRLATSFYTLLSTMYVMWCLLFSVYYYYFYIFFIFFLFYLFFSCFLEHHSFLLKIVGSLLVKLSICLQSPYLPKQESAILQQIGADGRISHHSFKWMGMTQNGYPRNREKKFYFLSLFASSSFLCFVYLLILCTLLTRKREGERTK